jgi:hypothetical protein
VVGRHAVRNRVERVIQRPCDLGLAGGTGGLQRITDAASYPARGDLFVVRAVGRRVDQANAGLDVLGSRAPRSRAGGAG